MSEDKCGCLHPIPIGTTESSIPNGLVSVGCGDLAECNDVNVSVWRYVINEGHSLVGNFIAKNCSELKICIEFDGEACGRTVLSLGAVIRGTGWCGEVEDEITYRVSDRILCWDIDVPGGDTAGCYSVAFNITPELSEGRSLHVLSAGYCCTQCSSCA